MKFFGILEDWDTGILEPSNNVQFDRYLFVLTILLIGTLSIDIRINTRGAGE